MRAFLVKRPGVTAIFLRSAPEQSLTWRVGRRHCKRMASRGCRGKQQDFGAVRAGCCGTRRPMRESHAPRAAVAQPSSWPRPIRKAFHREVRTTSFEQ